MDIIPETSPKRLTSETNFSNYILIVGACLKQNMVWKELIHNKQCIKLDMFQSIF